MRISDWSSDVCSSDLGEIGEDQQPEHIADPVDRGIAHQRGGNAVDADAQAERYRGDRRPARQDRSLDRGHRADRLGSDRDTGDEGAYLSRGRDREPGHYDPLKLRPDGPPADHAWRPNAGAAQELAQHSERRA